MNRVPLFLLLPLALPPIILILISVISCDIALSEKLPPGRFSIIETVPAKRGDRISAEDAVRVRFSKKGEAGDIREILTLSEENGEVPGTWELENESWLFSPRAPFQEGIDYYLIIDDPLQARSIRFTVEQPSYPPIAGEIEAFGYLDSQDPERAILSPFEEGGSCKIPPKAIPCIDFADGFAPPAPVERWITTDPPIEGDWYLHNSLLRFFPSPSPGMPKEWMVLIEGEPILGYLADEPSCTLEEVTLSGEESISITAPFEESDPEKVKSGSVDGGLSITLLFSTPLDDEGSREKLLDRLAINPIFPAGSPYPVLTGFQWLTDRCLFLNYRNFLSNPPGREVLYRVSIAPGEAIEPEGLTFLTEVGP